MKDQKADKNKESIDNFEEEIIELMISEQFIEYLADLQEIDLLDMD